VVNNYGNDDLHCAGDAGAAVLVSEWSMMPRLCAYDVRRPPHLLEGAAFDLPHTLAADAMR
jgi:hypothetical protein